MDRTLTNLTPDLSGTDPALRDRILAGHSAVLSQIEYFRENFGQTESSWKKDGTRVTVVDETISGELFLPLSNAFPEDDYFSEESIETPDPVPLKAEFCWLLDPVDGTNNYAVGITECGISLALLRNGTPIYGFIYDYSRDKLLQGGPGLGAIEGTTPVQAATELVNEKLTFCMHFPIPTADLDMLRPKLKEWRIRCPGSAAIGLANVATGNLAGFFPRTIHSPPACSILPCFPAPYFAMEWVICSRSRTQEAWIVTAGSHTTSCRVPGQGYPRRNS